MRKWCDRVDLWKHTGSAEQGNGTLTLDSVMFPRLCLLKKWKINQLKLEASAAATVKLWFGLCEVWLRRLWKSIRVKFFLFAFCYLFLALTSSIQESNDGEVFKRTNHQPPETNPSEHLTVIDCNGFARNESLIAMMSETWCETQYSLTWRKNTSSRQHQSWPGG